MFEAMEARQAARRSTCLAKIRRDSEADRNRAAEHSLTGLEFLVVQDLFYTKHGGTRRCCAARRGGLVRKRRHRDQQRAAGAACPPRGAASGRAFATISKLFSSWRAAWAMTGACPNPKKFGMSCASLSPMHAGMSYRRLEEMGGIQWPCYDESHPGEMFLHGRLWNEPLIGPRAPFSIVEFEPPVDPLDEQFPIRLTTGRRLG